MHATQVKVNQVLRTWVFHRVYYFYSLRQCDITLILDVFFPSCKRFLSLVNIFFHWKCNPLFVPHLKRCIVCTKSFSCTLSLFHYFFFRALYNATFPLGLFDLIRLRHFIWNRKIKKNKLQIRHSHVKRNKRAIESAQSSMWTLAKRFPHIVASNTLCGTSQQPTTKREKKKYPDEMRMKREMKKKTSHRLERVKSKVKKWMHTGKKHKQTNKPAKTKHLIVVVHSPFVCRTAQQIPTLSQHLSTYFLNSPIVLFIHSFLVYHLVLLTEKKCLFVNDAVFFNGFSNQMVTSGKLVIRFDLYD